MSCECQDCKEQYKVDLLIPDTLWETIKPKGKPEGSGLLCGSCIMKKIEQLNNYMSFDGGENVFRIIEDNNRVQFYFKKEK